MDKIYFMEKYDIEKVETENDLLTKRNQEKYINTKYASLQVQMLICRFGFAD